MRFWFLILLIANVGLGALIYAKEKRAPPYVPSTDLNAGKIRLVAFPPDANAKKATTGKSDANGVLICLRWSGIPGADLSRVNDLLSPIVPANNIEESRVEEPSRFWVNIPAAGNPSAMLARLKAAGVTDAVAQPDNAISLGLFSSEEAAERYLTQIQAKGFARAKIEPRSPHVKEATLLIKDVRKNVADRVGEFTEEFAGSSVQTIECPAKEENMGGAQGR